MILACGTVGTMVAYVDTVYIEQADVFLLGIGMYSCLELVDVWAYIGTLLTTIDSLLARIVSLQSPCQLYLKPRSLFSRVKVQGHP